MFLTKHRKRLSMLESWAIHDALLYRAFTKLITSLGYPLDAVRILDIGCGTNAPMTVMLHSAGARVTGIDEYIGYRWGLNFKPSRYLSYLREAGVAKILRKAIGELIYDRCYYINLANIVGFPLSEEGIDLREMRADNLQFENNTFDFIHSNATWEHLPDVDLANQEVARVLRPGGIAYIEIHLFPSLSGGHDLSWIVPGKTDLGNLLPWSHLRDPAWKEPIYLNRLREKNYRCLFEETQTLEIVDWKTEFVEGEEFITEELLSELSDFTTEELTKRSINIILRKKSAD